MKNPKIKKKKPKLKMIRVEDKLHRYLKGEAYRRGMTIAQLVERIIIIAIETPEALGYKDKNERYWNRLFSGVKWPGPK